MIRIRSLVNGFRRCGVVHSTNTTEWPDSAFTPEQLEALKAEPLLHVEIVADSKAKKTAD